MKRPELGVTLSKIHCWRLTQYNKCVFLDADTLILQNVDELFSKEELSAVPDIGWPDCFNSGVFVFSPSEDTFRALLKLAIDSGSFDGGDQGLLNTYFSDWRTKDVSRILSFIYNMSSIGVYSYPPAYKKWVLFSSNSELYQNCFVSDSVKTWKSFTSWERLNPGYTHTV